MKAARPTSQGSGWIFVAAREFADLMSWLHFESWTEAARRLHVNRRTLAKLHHPTADSTLSLETVDRIFHAAFQVRSLDLEPGETVENVFDKLAAARFRITLSVAVKPAAADEFVDEMQQRTHGLPPTTRKTR